MNNKLIFIRHAKTKIDKEVSIEDWVLTDEGQKEAEKIANSDEFDDVDLLISSDEKKAYLTIKPLADKLKKEIIQVQDLGEIQRPNAEKLSKEEYEEMKVKIFEDRDFSQYDWETANHALKRFKDAVTQIDDEQENKKILICSHGTVMTLFFAYLQNKLDNLMQRWKDLKFGAVGIVKNKKVITDVV